MYFFSRNWLGWLGWWVGWGWNNGEIGAIGGYDRGRSLSQPQPTKPMQPHCTQLHSYHKLQKTHRTFITHTQSAHVIKTHIALAHTEVANSECKLEFWTKPMVDCTQKHTAQIHNIQHKHTQQQKTHRTHTAIQIANNMILVLNEKRWLTAHLSHTTHYTDCQLVRI